MKNYNSSVKKRGSTITFLRRIVRGPADGSYGIEVAKLAGVPSGVVNRAREILLELENEDRKLKTAAKAEFGAEEEEAEEPLQLSLESKLDDEIIDELKNIDTDTLTPLEALTTLYKLAQKARNK